jgi:hypothetical protein
MPLNVVKRDSRSPSQSGKSTDLINTVFEYLLLGLGQLSPAEMFPIREAGMSADPYLVACRRLNRSECNGRITRMESAGHIGRGDKRHQLLIQAATFPQIAIQVDFHNRHYKVEEIRPQAPAVPQAEKFKNRRCPSTKRAGLAPKNKVTLK